MATAPPDKITVTKTIIIIMIIIIIIIIIIIWRYQVWDHRICCFYWENKQCHKANITCIDNNLYPTLT